jgi:hypothetical protein
MSACFRILASGAQTKVVLSVSARIRFDYVTSSYVAYMYGLGCMKKDMQNVYLSTWNVILSDMETHCRPIGNLLAITTS